MAGTFWKLLQWCAWARVLGAWPTLSPPASRPCPRMVSLPDRLRPPSRPYCREGLGAPTKHSQELCAHSALRFGNRGTGSGELQRV